MTFNARRWLHRIRVLHERLQVSDSFPAKVMLDFLDSDKTASDDKRRHFGLGLPIKSDLHGVQHVRLPVIPIEVPFLDAFFSIAALEAISFRTLWSERYSILMRT
jgi:hypothetical protein